MPDPSPAPLTPEEDARLPKSLDPVLAGFRVFTNDRCCSLAEERQCEAEALALERDILALVDELAALREENERLRAAAPKALSAAFFGTPVRTSPLIPAGALWANDEWLKKHTSSEPIPTLSLFYAPKLDESGNPIEPTHICGPFTAASGGWELPPAPAQEAREG